MQFLDNPGRFLFFTGKGGVGKTSVACATALTLAEEGKSVLLVSTDPASNLADVLEFVVGDTPTKAPYAPTLQARNIDPEAAAEVYRERVIVPYRDKLPESSIKQIEEQLSGACTIEIAAFEEFTELLTENEALAGYDHIVFDTAPTGHTLRLLQLPASWTGFLDTNERGASCLGPHSGLAKQREQFAAAMEALNDAARTTVILVTRAEQTALTEAARTSSELKELGLRNQTLLVNGVFSATDPTDALAQALEREGRACLESLPHVLRDLPRDEVPLKGVNIIGVEALRDLFSADTAPGSFDADSVHLDGVREKLQSLAALTQNLGEAKSGLIMVMGKGGVGKTTLAAAIAVALADQGHDVHLTTTDPAAHLEAAIGEDVPNLRVSRIDPKEETRRYTEHVLEHSGKHLDEEGRALLEEDLRSPCTEEVAVFHAFSKIVSQARREIVVMDTAPTGHTLLLLDATGSYHREVLRSMKGAGNVVTPLMRLRDPDYTKVLVATLPESTPVYEAQALQEDLRRAKIEPYAWVINRSLAIGDHGDPLLRERAAAEMGPVEKVIELSAHTPAAVPWVAVPPVGPEQLRKLMQVAAVQPG